MKSKSKLVIISDTPMWRDSQGVVNVYEPTLREIEYVTHIFEEVVWLGFNRPNYKFGNGRGTGNPRIKLKLLTGSGGHTVVAKAKSILLLPYYCVVIFYYFVSAQYVHTRGPSVPALIAILYSFLFPTKVYWNKYAGNWGATAAPFFYRLQKKLVLRATFSKVTINGRWGDQKPHILSFENPCFNGQEFQAAGQTGAVKKFDRPLLFCFAGRLEAAKGVGNLINALKQFANADGIGSFVFAGDGELKDQFSREGQTSKIEMKFLGALPRKELNEVYAKAHFIVLPSLSEGFPKVLSEAAAFGCIPIATDVSALSQHIKHGQTGFLMPNNESQTIFEALKEVLEYPDLKGISLRARAMVRLFTYEEFVERLNSEIFKLKIER